MRVALAGVLFSQPDLLLLDEPTNYLDLEGTLWLEKYLATYPYTVLMISHDRDLLNKAVNSIIHLERGKLTFYNGNYDTFEETRRMQMELNNKSREKTLDADRAPAEVRRPLQGQGDQGRAGAGARQDDREAEAAGGDVRRVLGAVHLPATQEGCRRRR